MGCTLRQARFVDLYLALSFNGTQAYIEAGYSAKTENVAACCAAKLLRIANVRDYLAVRAKAMFDRVEAEQDRLMRTLTAVAFADPNELVSYRRGACRHCYGVNNRYQFTAGEWERRLEDHEKNREELLARDKADPGPLDGKGGVGYDKRRDPNPDCPECFGDGLGEQVIKDTRNLSPAALALYAGVEECNGGVRIKLNDQNRARELLAKIHGLFDERHLQFNITFNYDELNKIYGEKMAKARARSEVMRRAHFGEAGA
jgi:phage terminase small subunit